MSTKRVNWEAADGGRHQPLKPVRDVPRGREPARRRIVALLPLS